MKPKKEMENNVFQFHLNSLQEKGYVEKYFKVYKLTKDGKKYAIRIDSDNAKVETQAKIGVALGCIRNINSGEKQILIYTRLKHAFFGCQVFPAGKIKHGESIIDAVKRELLEETDLIGEPEIVGILHYRIFNTKGDELLDDLLLFLCRFDNPKGKLKGSKEGKYEWVGSDKISEYIVKPFQSKHMFLREVEILLKNKKTPIIIEEVYNDKTNF